MNRQREIGMNGNLRLRGQAACGENTSRLCDALLLVNVPMRADIGQVTTSLLMGCEPERMLHSIQRLRFPPR